MKCTEHKRRDILKRGTRNTPHFVDPVKVGDVVKVLFTKRKEYHLYVLPYDKLMFFLSLGQ